MSNTTEQNIREERVSIFATHNKSDYYYKQLTNEEKKLTTLVIGTLVNTEAHIALSSSGLSLLYNKIGERIKEINNE